MKKQILPIIIALIPIAIAIYLYPELPEKIPGHYNIKGEVDRYDSKWTVFITASLGLFVYGLMLFIKKYDPKGRITAMGSKYDTLSLWLTILLSILSLIIIGSASSSISSDNMFKSLHLFLGILFLILGNYMTSMKQNYFIGIRTPWTLESEEVWRKTHQLGGRLFFSTGLFLVLLCFLPIDSELKNKIMLGLLIISSVIPLVYSFVIHKKTSQTANILILLFLSTALNAQNNQEVFILSGTDTIRGSLVKPLYSNTNKPLALIISGSGPTDRNGNNPMMTNNSLKMLADSLAKNGIASLRFDKRGIAKSTLKNFKEEDMRFGDMVHDIKLWLYFIRQEKGYKNISIIGHSEGSLIGILASQNATKFISLAGPGSSADLILKEQLSKQPDQVKNLCFPIIDSLKKGKLVDSVSPFLYSLFRPSVQPYMISWFQYDPSVELSKLKMPILIIQGDKDLQVPIKEADKLKNGIRSAEYKLIPDMNHVLKIIKGDDKENAASYKDPKLPISSDLVKVITEFIKK